MSTSCGELITSVQKDGWSYAVNASDGGMRWQFPPTILTDAEDLFLNDVHGDDDYEARRRMERCAHYKHRGREPSAAIP